MTTIITLRRLNIIIPAVPPRKNRNKVAEEIVAHATAVAIAEAAKVVADGVAHKVAVIQNLGATVAPQAASKKLQVNAVIVAEVVTAKYGRITAAYSYRTHGTMRQLLSKPCT